MLKINNLFVTVENKEIIKGVSLTIKPGEIHALMGPNGSGKSSLAMALVGHPRYKVANSYIRSHKSYVRMDGVDIINKTPDERARMGLFLASQYPVGVEGVTVEQLLRRAKQEVIDYARVVISSDPPAGGESRDPAKRSRSVVLGDLDSSTSERNISPTAKAYVSSLEMTRKRPIDVLQFRKSLEKLAKKVGVNRELLFRSINVGFSGGEKKRLEILQMLVLQPRYVILDETDSGLDVDALRIVAAAVKNYVSARSKRRGARGNGPRATNYQLPAVLVITHYARLLQYLKPDVVHIMKEGKIARSGSMKIVVEIEKKGYK